MKPSSCPKLFLFIPFKNSCLYSMHKKIQAASTYQLRCCLRDIAVIELLFATGMRISELCSLRPSDIDLENNTVLIYGKGAKERILQLGNPEVISALMLYHKKKSLNRNFVRTLERGRLLVRRARRCSREDLEQFQFVESLNIRGWGRHAIQPPIFRTKGVNLGQYCRCAAGIFGLTVDLYLFCIFLFQRA